MSDSIYKIDSHDNNAAYSKNAIVYVQEALAAGETFPKSIKYYYALKNVPQNKALSQNEFHSILKVICEMVVKYMQSKIEGLPTLIATPFAFDFITQLLMSASTVITDKGDEYDPMFG